MINTLTVNPAVDKLLRLTQLRKGVTNRPSSMTETVGGKGTHVSMNLQQMGLANRAFGVCCGDTGRFITDALEREGISTYFLDLERDKSRTNYILIEQDGTCTTISERGPQLEPEDLKRLLSLMKREMGEDEYLVLSGDASNCKNPDIYKDIACALSDKRVRVVLDADGATLQRSLDSHPFLIKPNQDELEMLCGFPMESTEDVLRGIYSLDGYGIEVIAVSLGARGSVVRFGKEYFEAIPPHINVQNTNGCGDSFLAALLYGYSTGMAYSEMLRFATAVSAATAASPLTVGYDDSLVQKLLPDVEITHLTV